ncbi:MAG TPA: IS200/IS605 family transposase [Thermoanaerobaculia bacterium]|nr:IS200/IS605 family transposase [Thermoanaerobaculia bacterium]
MPHSYSSILVHIVFSTENRKPQLDPALEERLYPYLGGIVRETGGSLFTVNGVEDHVHLLASLSGKLAIAEVVRRIKGSSSKWIHETFPERAQFAWQRGYGAFTVSQSQVPRVAAYIERQKVHHARMSFRDEFVRLLKGHGISPDERYLWT